MRIIVCPDSFKGTLTSAEAARAIAAGVRDCRPEAEVVCLPIGDGGEGTAAAVGTALGGIEEITCETVDALRRPIRAGYVIADGKTALIESAAASGLTLIHPDERDIMKADTYGTGLLIKDAYRRGIRRFMICMGGTATCDGGYGAYAALRGITPGEIDLTLLCDVDNPLCGPRGAAAVFAPQKGARPEQIALLDRLLEERAATYREATGVDITAMRHAGAAGGLAGMLMACYGAVAEKGIDKVLELLDFDRHLEGADLVITGEGRADKTTLHGKAPMGVLEAASRRGVATVLIGGRVSHREALVEAGFRRVVQATPEGSDCSVRPAAYLREATHQIWENSKNLN